MHTSKITSAATRSFGVLLASFIVLFFLNVSPVLAQTANTTVTDITNPVSTSGYCANVPTSFKNLSDLFKYATCFLERMILPLLFLSALALFIFGVVKFIGNTDSSEREQGQQFMIWGVVGLAVMFSLWGLVNLFSTTFKIGGVVPTVPVTNPTIIK